MEQAADIKKLKEQRDLLIDLKQKNAMLEREIDLINEKTEKDMVELEEYRQSKENDKLNRRVANEIEQNNAGRTKQILE